MRSKVCGDGETTEKEGRGEGGKERKVEAMECEGGEGGSEGRSKARGGPTPSFALALVFGTESWNSPWPTTESGFADILAIFCEVKLCCS